MAGSVAPVVGKAPDRAQSGAGRSIVSERLAKGAGILRTMPPQLSVVIPAHNEQNVIARALNAIFAGPASDDLQVVVVTNGCTDSTAERAKDFPSVQVVAVSEASKIAALNAGDSAVTVFPRAYVDADVVVTQEALLALADVLSGPEPLVASPSMHLNTSRSSWLVKQYYRVWEIEDYRLNGHIGSGVYALSRAGRARFGKFPQLIADDRYVQRLFTLEERVTLKDHQFIVEAPRTLKAVVRRGVRIAAGNQQLAGMLPQERSTSAPSKSDRLRHRVLRQPRLWVPFFVFYIVRAAIQRRAKRMVLRSAQIDWSQDTTTRG